MSATRAATSSISQGLPKSRSLLAGNAPILSGSYESIATVTVGAGGTSSVSFSSIPSTYKHLQIRAIYETVTNIDNIGMTLNGSTAQTRSHFLYGFGASAGAGDTTSNWFTVQAGVSTTTFYAMIIDLLDYTNTNKYKTVRALNGVDFNGSGCIALSSALYATTSAVSSLSIQPAGGANLAQYSSFALYGIK